MMDSPHTHPMWAVGFIWGDFTTYYANVGLGASRMPFIMVAFGGDAYASENNLGVACQMCEFS